MECELLTSGILTLARECNAALNLYRTLPFEKLAKEQAANIFKSCCAEDGHYSVNPAGGTYVYALFVYLS